MNKIMGFFAICLILVITPVAANAAPSFVNNSFETGNTTGWSTSGGAYATTPCAAAGDGNYYGWVGNYDNPGSFSQTVGGFVPGQTYRLSFLAASETTGTSDIVRLDITGANTSYQEWTVSPASSTCWDNWEMKSVTFTANSSSITFNVYGYSQPYDVGVDLFELTDVGAPAGIPTLTQWGMILLSTLLALGAALTLRRRRQ